MVASESQVPVAVAQLETLGSITSMNTVLLVFALVWLVGMIPLLIVCWLTRQIRAPWVRQLPRALVAALTFTPSFIVVDGQGGFAVPAPAVVVLFGAGPAKLLPIDILDMVVVPVAFCFMVFWGLACLVSFIKRKLSHAA